MSHNNLVYKRYKPLRNHLKKVSIEDALSVIWAYAQYFQFDKKFPEDIEFPSVFANKTNKENMALLSPWELKVLAERIIIDSEDISINKETFKNVNYFFGAVNKLKELENEISEIYIKCIYILFSVYDVCHF